MDIWIRVRRHPFACDGPVFPAPFVEKIVLSPLNGLATVVENQLAVNVSLFLNAHVCSLEPYACPYARATLRCLL